MDDESKAFLVGILLGAGIGCIATLGFATGVWRSDLVERGLALYCPTDGEFAFNDECAK